MSLSDEISIKASALWCRKTNPKGEVTVIGLGNLPLDRTSTPLEPDFMGFVPKSTSEVSQVIGKLQDKRIFGQKDWT